jgi:chromosome segregation protein
MYLEKIEIQGFKSFADRTILEFPKPTSDTHTVTIIVGPNGSGKSNVSDAIKWVLGEQSMKNIRGKKAEDVIFSGSEKRGRVGFAEVSLYLNNESGKAPIDYSEMVITRRLYRDGQSEYLLNKNPIRLLDINLLLAKAHFGQKSFSIIGQGMIDSVLLATPLERKAFFDEAVGVKEHQIKRHQALNKLERSEENLDQAGLLLKEITPQLKSLTRQVKKLEQREELIAKLREYQQEYYNRLWVGLTKTQTEQTTSAGELQKELSVLEEQLAEKRNDLETLEKQESRSHVFNDLQQQVSAKQQERNRLLREMTVLKGRREVDLEKQGKLDLAWLYRQEEEISQRIIEVEKELDALKTDHTAVADKKTNTIAEIASLKDKMEKLTKQVEQLKEEIKSEATKGPLTSLKRRIKEVSSVFATFYSKLKKADTPEQLAELEKYAQSLETQLKELHNHVTLEIDGISKEEDVQLTESQELWGLQQELNQLISSHERLAPELTQLEIKAKVLEEKRQLKERDLDQLRQELVRTTSQLSSQKAAQDGKVDEGKLDEEQEKLDKEISKLDKAIAELQEKIADFNKEEEDKQSRVFQLEREYQGIQASAARLQQKKHTIEVELARTETKLEDLMTEITRELGDPTLVQKRPEDTKNDMDSYPTDHLFSQIEKFKYQLELIGGIDPETVEEYKAVKERHDFLDEQIKDLESTMTKLEQVITELDTTITKQFDKAFTVINKEFERYFQILFGGGRAKLIKVMEETKEVPASETEVQQEVVDELMQEEPEEKEQSRAKKFKRSDLRGVDIYASPAGKKLSTIAMLSGGERSLTSLALIAAIIHHNPSPFILMDEVDAALDEANSKRMANVLSELRKQTQFVIITHNRTIMNIADTIYGVTMGNDGVSKLLSVKLEELDSHTTRL